MGVYGSCRSLSFLAVVRGFLGTTAQAVTYAQADQEVLILPLDPLPGVVGLTGLLDFGCATAVELYDLV